MKEKIIRLSLVAAILFVVILLFAAIDYPIHTLGETWNVPDYYFKNKILFGFLWGIIGLLIAGRFKSIWLKAASVATIVSVTLQFRYFIEGYALDFVLLFLLIHFLILFFLSILMFLILNKYK